MCCCVGLVASAARLLASDHVRKHTPYAEHLLLAECLRCCPMTTSCFGPPNGPCGIVSSCRRPSCWSFLSTPHILLLLWQLIVVVLLPAVVLVVNAESAAATTAMSFDAMMDKVKASQGFLAALDQSGGSTPKALKAFGIPDDVRSCCLLWWGVCRSCMYTHLLSLCL